MAPRVSPSERVRADIDALFSSDRTCLWGARVSTNESRVGARPAVIVLEARQRLVSDGVQVERPQRSEDERPGGRRPPGVPSCASDDS